MTEPAQGRPGIGDKAAVGNSGGSGCRRPGNQHRPRAAVEIKPGMHLVRSGKPPGAKTDLIGSAIGNPRPPGKRHHFDRRDQYRTDGTRADRPHHATGKPFQSARHRCHPRDESVSPTDPASSRHRTAHEDGHCRDRRGPARPAMVWPIRTSCRAGQSAHSMPWHRLRGRDGGPPP